MVKSITSLFLFLLAFPLTLCSQSDGYNYDMQGLHPEYLVVDMPDTDQATLFKKAKSWAQTGNRTIQSSDASNSITFQGEKANALCFTVRNKTSCNNLRYTVEVAFKDNKYKFEVKNLEQYGPINDTGKKGWFPVELDKAPDAFYTRGGELKKEYVATPGNISGLFNDLNAAFKKALTKEKGETKKDDW